MINYEWVMMMQRYFIHSPVTDHVVLCDTNQVNHIKTVVGLKQIDTSVLVDETGASFLMQITRIEKDCVHLKRLQALPKLRKPTHVTLALSMIEKAHFNVATQKAIELGADLIYPIETERSRHTIKKGDTEWGPYQRSMAIDALDLSVFDTVLIAYENNDTTPLHVAFESLSSHAKILLIIGPEGGFTEREVTDLIQKNAQPITLGKRLFRSETAAIYALSVLHYLFEKRCQS